MCAAPGSKTFQILEMLHTGSSGIPEGLVIANDADAQRCNLLTHQTKRHGSPCLIVTNHEGQFFPHVKLPGNVSPSLVRPSFDHLFSSRMCWWIGKGGEGAAIDEAHQNRMFLSWPG